MVDSMVPHRPLRKLLGTCLLTLCAFPLWTEPKVLSDKALALARTLEARRMGIDREGNLWTWEGRSGRVLVYSPAGAEILSTFAREAIDVDVDRQWGVAGIFSQGFELRLAPFAGDADVSLRLKDRVQGVAWIGPHSVAVSPALAAHRVEIWDTRQRTILRKLGAEEVLVPKPGVTIMRTVLLHYDPKRDLLYTLDSFRGDLQVFALDGRLVRKEQVPKADRKELEDSIAKADRQMRAHNEAFTPAFWWFRQAVDEEGTVWSVQECDKENGKAVFFKVPLEGQAQSITVAEPCCSRSLVIWTGWLIFYSDTAMPRSTCDTVRRLP
jgi:hypothetical protein